jgi:hypothetical protein
MGSYNNDVKGLREVVAVCLASAALLLPISAAFDALGAWPRPWPFAVASSILLGIALRIWMVRVERSRESRKFILRPQHLKLAYACTFFCLCLFYFVGYLGFNAILADLLHWQKREALSNIAGRSVGFPAGMLFIYWFLRRLGSIKDRGIPPDSEESVRSASSNTS